MHQTCSYKFVGECSQINQVFVESRKSQQTKKAAAGATALQLLRLTHALFARCPHKQLCPVCSPVTVTPGVKYYHFLIG